MVCQKVGQDFHIQNFCVLVTAITNEKDNCKFMLDAAIRVCSLSAELIKLVGKRLATSSDFYIL